MKLFRALAESINTRDTKPVERFDYSKVRSTIEDACNKYLKDSSDVLTFEALPSAIDSTLLVLQSQAFKESYEFEQVSETLFKVRMKDIDLLD